ncbi:TetR/AcrR family transcriptional regulator [Leptospira barantonii]|uniref:TetR family transcriptional regulator n=1 Tax=Leptospira barantonii TaxID=2023184 RepID=A0ABX4NKK5_9LEPT|nr:TetR/AcrR family transcriptional regulator [Leptospira barantonii]PJZ57263.1 TetR family transcriptional regulator [Leptospira barantonii]
MKISQKESELKRKTILEAGIRLVRLYGPDGIGIQEIADESKIPKGSFYNYFTSKDQFLLEALEEYTNNAILWNEQTIEKGGRGLSALTYLYEQKILLETELLQDGFSCLINVLAQHSSSKRMELRNRLKDSLDRISNEILNSLQVNQNEKDKQKNSDIGANENVLHRIQFLESSWRGAMLLARATGETSYLERFRSETRFLER